MVDDLNMVMTMIIISQSEQQNDQATASKCSLYNNSEITGMATCFEIDSMVLVQTDMCICFYFFILTTQWLNVCPSRTEDNH